MTQDHSAQPGADDLHHRGMVIVDIADSNSRRDDVKRLHRTKLRELMSGAIEDAGIQPEQYDPPDDTGDGLRVYFKPDVGKNRLVGPMVAALAERLARYNLTAPGNAHMRLRMLVSAADLRRDSHGFFGTPLNEACWLVDSSELRDCLRGSASDTVLMVTENIYKHVLKNGYGDTDPDRYEPHTVSLKNGEEVQAWVSWPDSWEQGMR